MGVLGFPVEQRQHLEVLGLRIKSGTVGTTVAVTAARAARTCRLGADSRIAECTCYACLKQTHLEPVQGAGGPDGVGAPCPGRLIRT